MLAVNTTQPEAYVCVWTSIALSVELHDGGSPAMILTERGRTYYHPRLIEDNYLIGEWLMRGSPHSRWT
jgi:hypothetical protein